MLYSGGYYVIEDIESSYWKQEVFGSNIQKSFVEHMKLLADVVNKKYMNQLSPLPALYNDVSFVFFGQNIIFVKKQTLDEGQYTGGFYSSDSANKSLPYPWWLTLTFTVNKIVKDFY